MSDCDVDYDSQQEKRAQRKAAKRSFGQGPTAKQTAPKRIRGFVNRWIAEFPTWLEAKERNGSPPAFCKLCTAFRNNKLSTIKV